MYSLVGPVANTTDLGQLQLSAANSGRVGGRPDRNSISLNALTGYIQKSVVLISTDSTTESDGTLTFRIDEFGNASSLVTCPLPSPPPPSPSTVRTPSRISAAGRYGQKLYLRRSDRRILGTGGNGPIAYSASGLPTGLIFDADGTGDYLGTEPRKVCGTPASGASGAQTVAIAAADADSITAARDRGALTVTVASGVSVASNLSPLTEVNLGWCQADRDPRLYRLHQRHFRVEPGTGRQSRCSEPLHRQRSGSVTGSESGPSLGKDPGTS